MFDLATAKTRLGIAGTTHDAVLTLTLDAALAIAEKYCDRKFMYAAETESFYYPFDMGLQLHRFPIEAVTSIAETGSPAKSFTYKASKNDGLLLFRGYVAADQVDVSYTGGYKTLPADLELAIWGVFDAIWPSISSPAVGGASSGDIESITVPDVGTIKYAKAGGAVSASVAGGLDGGTYGAYFSILDLYRLRVC